MEKEVLYIEKTTEQELLNKIQVLINEIKPHSYRLNPFKIKVITKGTARKILDLNNATFDKYKDFELIPVIQVENKMTGKFFTGYNENTIVKIKPVIDQIKRTRESLEKYEQAKKEIISMISNIDY